MGRLIHLQIRIYSKGYNIRKRNEHIRKFYTQWTEIIKQIRDALIEIKGKMKDWEKERVELLTQKLRGEWEVPKINKEFRGDMRKIDQSSKIQRRVEWNYLGTHRALPTGDWLNERNMSKCKMHFLRGGEWGISRAYICTLHGNRGYQKVIIKEGNTIIFDDLGPGYKEDIFISLIFSVHINEWIFCVFQYKCKAIVVVIKKAYMPWSQTVHNLVNDALKFNHPM